MQELLVDFIASLDGYGEAEGWPGWWGVEAPEYLRWLDETEDRDALVLMGANTYRLMSGMSAQAVASEGASPRRRRPAWPASPPCRRWCSPRRWRRPCPGPTPSW